AVVADLQRRDAATGLLAFLQLDQVLVGVGGQATQLVEFRIVAVGDHAAVALQYRRLFDQGTGEQGGGFRVVADVFDQGMQQRTVQRGDLLAQHRRGGEAVAQGGK